MGFIEYMQSPAGKRITGVAYSLGASVVIIGALFKIQHWPGAGIMLCTGMFIEAVLFGIGAFDKPHKEFDWSIIYPELDEDANKELAEAKRAENLANAGVATPLAQQPAQQQLSVPEINPTEMVEEQVKKLAEGVKSLNATAAQIGTISSAAAESQNYVNNLNMASQAASAFAASQASLTNSSNDLVASYQNIANTISSASNGSSNFAAQMDGMVKNISTINSSFEMQVKAVNEQNNAMQNLSAAVSKIQTSLEGSAADADAYKAQIGLLKTQMEQLNKVYGGMLSAMTIRG